MIQLSSLLVTGADGRWHPGVGDATVLGWVTVLAYFLAAFLAFRAMMLHRASAQLGSARALSTNDEHEERLLVRFWAVVVLVMLVLGVNKQLDLQTWLTEVGRDVSRSQGWYERRRPVQAAFIVLIALVGGASTLLLARTMRRALRRVIGAVLGIGALVTFVVVRAASFHYVDVLLGRGRVHLNWVLELGGIALIATSALGQTRRFRD